jgi:hypothetical protein
VVALAVSSALEGFVWTSLTVAGIALTIVGNVVAMWPSAQMATRPVQGPPRDAR